MWTLARGQPRYRPLVAAFFHSQVAIDERCNFRSEIVSKLPTDLRTITTIHTLSPRRWTVDRRMRWRRMSRRRRRGRAERRKIRELLSRRRAAAANRGGIGGGIGGIGGGPAGRGGADTPAPAPLGALLKSGSNKSINLFFIVALPPLGVNAGAFADIPRPLSPPEDDADADADTADASPRTEPLVSSSAPSPSPSTPKMRSRANLYSSSRSSAVRVSTLPDVDFDLARASIAALDSPSAFPSSPSRVGLARTATRTFRRALDSVSIASRRVVVVVVVPTARARERIKRTNKTNARSLLARARSTTDDRGPTTDDRRRRARAVGLSRSFARSTARARDRSIGRVSMGLYHARRGSARPRVRATDRARRPRARVPTTTRGRGIFFLARASPSRARDDARIAWNRAKSRAIAIVDTSAPHPSRDDATSSVGARERASASNGSR